MGQAIEYTIEWEGGHWAASARVDGGLATGIGASPWEAIGACALDIPLERERHEHWLQALERARAGRFRCPGCGHKRPPLTDATPVWFPFCERCRGEELTEAVRSR